MEYVDRRKWYEIRWEKMEEQAEEAERFYEKINTKEGIRLFKELWKDFQIDFSKKVDRERLDESYIDTISMVLNRIYVELDETEDRQEMWDFCWSVCQIFDPQEIWITDYACCIGRILQARGKWELCDEWFRTYIFSDPKQPAYVGYWAKCMIDRGSIERAREMLRLEMAVAPVCDGNTLDFYLTAWEIYRVLGDEEMIKQCETRIGKLDPYLVKEANQHWNMEEV